MKKTLIIASLAVFGLLAIGTLSAKADTTSDDTATSTPVITSSAPAPIFKMSFPGRIDNFTTSQYTKFSNLFGKVAFLTTFKSHGCVVVNNDKLFCEKGESVYHYISIPSDIKINSISAMATLGGKTIN